MKQILYVQNTFDNGINEGIKQDGFNTQYDSALLISNYNPNIERGALIKRKGLLPIPIKHINNVTRCFDIEHKSPLNNLLFKKINDIVYFGVINQHTPKENKMYYIITEVKAKSDTSPLYFNETYLKIFAYTYWWVHNTHENPNILEGPNWYNAFNEDFETDYKTHLGYPINYLVGRGTYIKGEFGNVARYGEELLIATKNSEYPLYIFKYVDFTSPEAKKKILKGVGLDNLSNKDKARHIVLPQSINLKNKVKFKRYSYRTENEVISKLDKLDDDTYFEVMILETHYASLEYNSTLPQGTYNDTTYDIIITKNLGATYLPLLDTYIKIENRMNLFKNPVIQISPTESINLYELNKLQVNPELIVDNIKRYVKIPEANHANITIDIPKYQLFEDYVKNKIDSANFEYDKIRYNSFSPTSEVGYTSKFDIINSSYSSIFFIDDTGTINNDINKKPVVKDLLNPDGKRIVTIYYEVWNHGGNEIKQHIPLRIRNRLITQYVTLPIYFIDYKSLGIPRPWVAGEEIPIAITVTIDGVEQIIAFHKYIVGYDSENNFYDSLSTYFTYMWDEKERIHVDYIKNPNLPQSIHHLYAYPQAIRYEQLPMDIAWGSIYGYIDNSEYKPSHIENDKTVYYGEVATITIPSSYLYTQFNNNPKLAIVKPNPGQGEIITPYINYLVDIFRSKLLTTLTNNILISPHIYNYVDVSGPNINDKLQFNCWIRERTFNDDSFVFLIKSENDNIKHHIKKSIGNLVAINIRINADKLAELISMGVTDINVYIPAQGDDSVFRSVGVSKPTKPSTSFYSQPKIKDIPNIDKDISEIDLTGFRLLKTFIIVGDDQEKIDLKTYSGEATQTNSWKNHSASNSVIHVDKYNHKINGATPDFWIWDYKAEGRPLILQGSGKYWEGKGAGLITVINGRVFLSQTYDKEGKLETGFIRYSVAIGGNISKHLFYDEDKLRVGSLNHTALINFREQLWVFNKEELYRFILPNIADTNTWELTDSIKGQGVLMQKHTTVSPYGVIFINESGIWISDGGKPENLLAGNSSLYGQYKIMYQKTNDYNIVNIPVAQYIYNNDGFNEYVELEYDNNNDEIVIASYGISLDITDDNIEYDKIKTTNNECTIKLIYNFKYQNWRIEKILFNSKPKEVLSTHGTYITPLIKQTNTKGKYLFQDDNIKNGTIKHTYSGDIFAEIDQIVENMYEDYLLVENNEDNNNVFNKIIGEIVTHELGDGKNDFLIHSNILELTPRIKYKKDFIVQYLQNGFYIDSHLVNSFKGIIQDIVKNKEFLGWKEYYYPQNIGMTQRVNKSQILADADPIFAFEARNRETIYDANYEYEQYQTFRDNKYWEDLIITNFRHKQLTGKDNMFTWVRAINPYASQLETPGGTSRVHSDPISKSPQGVARESLVLIGPRAPFRIVRYYFRSYLTEKIKSIMMKVSMNKRRI